MTRLLALLVALGGLLAFALRPEPVVFLGDSITRRLDTQAIVPGSVNLGVDGRVTNTLLADLPSFRNVRLVVLTIGTNDVNLGMVPGLESRYRALSHAIPVPVVWSGIAPNARHDVTAANAMIARVCAERPDCTFVPSPVRREDLLPDGVHLAPSGYARWMDALRKGIR